MGRGDDHCVAESAAKHFPCIPEYRHLGILPSGSLLSGGGDIADSPQHHIRHLAACNVSGMARAHVAEANDPQPHLVIRSLYMSFFHTAPFHFRIHYLIFISFCHISKSLQHILRHDPKRLGRIFVRLSSPDSRHDSVHYLLQRPIGQGKGSLSSLRKVQHLVVQLQVFQPVKAPQMGLQAQKSVISFLQQRPQDTFHVSVPHPRRHHSAVRQQSVLDM